jgi:hypothetical protein
MRPRTAAAAVLVLALGACGDPGDAAVDLDPAPTTVTADIAVTVQPASGDRRADGSGDITQVTPIEIDLPNAAVWVVATVTNERLEVVATRDDGMAVWITVSDSNEQTVLGIAPIGPPAVSFGPDGPSFVAPDPEALGPPLVVDGVVWWTGSDGSIHRGVEPVGIDGLPDGRLAAARDGSIAALTDPTDRYPHGALGDDLEAASVTILEPDGTVRSVTEIDGVVEGLSPLWADLDGDGAEEVVVTVSDAADGARIVVLDRAGAVIASGEPIGIGNRWRHQIGTVRDPLGTRAIVVVKTPHIGGVAEYWRLVGGGLELVATRSGITSHTIRSRNLDLAVIVDADGDGVEELVAPTGDLRALVGVSFTEDGAGEAWRQPLPAPLATNLHVATDGDRAWLVAGLADGRILVWPPATPE